MGVADNRSYKDEYLFHDDRTYNIKEQQPSIAEDPEINSTIKENPYRSNVEIEGGEIVLQPDLSALFKAHGKKHSKGGMDVLLKPESFIFSDWKGLAFNKTDHELMELKEGGKSKDPLKNTPAEVLKRNIDVKHYNTMISILEDPYKDDLSKKSAALMLEKYLQSLGNIAYIQEEKKGFPQGLPAFSMGTAPVYNQDIKNEIMENKQYMKAGGTTQNPYLQTGGTSRRPKNSNAIYDPITQLWYSDPSKLPQNPNLTQAQRDTVNMGINFNFDNQSTYAPGTTPNWMGFPYWKISQHVSNEINRATSDIQNKYIGIDFTGYSPSGNGQYYQNGYPMPRSNAPVGSLQSQTQGLVTPPVKNAQTQTVAKAQSPAWGLWQGDKLPIFQDRYGVTNAADKFDTLKDWNAVVSGLGYTGPKNNLAFQKWLYNSSPENKAVIDKWHQQYSKGPNAGMFDSKVGIRWANAINEIMGKKSPTTPATPLNTDETVDIHDELSIQQKQTQLQDPIAGTVDGIPQGSKQANWRFTPWQKISQLNNLGQFANVRRYMPYRSRYNATYVDPALVNPEQTVGDIQAAGNQQISSLRTLSPILRNAQASSIMGQVMNTIPGVRSQYDNQNAQILNQTRQYNNQVKNNESLVNLGYDQQYYREAVEGRKNFDNMRNFTWNEYMNNVLRDVETNQKLSYNLLTQNNPAYGFDWRTGKFTRTNKSIMDVQANPINERYNDMLQSINQISDPIERNKLLVKLEGIKTFGNAQQTPPVFKKGGKNKTKKNPY